MPREEKQVLGPDRNFALGTDGIESDAGAGAKNGSTVTAYEMGIGDSSIHRTKLTLASTPVTIADEAGVGGYGGVKLYDMPAGRIKILGAIVDLGVVKSGDGISATFDGDFSLGTVVAGNDATLTGTEADIIPSTATPQAVAGITTADGNTLLTVAAQGAFTAGNPAATAADPDALTSAALTENSSAIGGTNNGDLPSLVDPAGDSGASVIAGIRENAAMINKVIADITSIRTQVIAAIVDIKANNAEIDKAVTDFASARTKLNAIIAALPGNFEPIFDGSSTAKDVYLNFLVDDADQDGGGTLLVSGTVTLLWVNIDNAA